MKKIEKFIRQNPGFFDFEEPPEGHMERFNSRLSSLVKRNRSGLSIMLLRIAAAVLLGLVITYASLREFGVLENYFRSDIASGTNTELNEAELFYTSQLSVCYDKIQNLKFNNDQGEKTKVLKELTEMDEQMQAMKHDLRQNPENERIVNAIINFYQVKLEMMDMIIARAQQTTNTIL